MFIVLVSGCVVWIDCFLIKMFGVVIGCYLECYVRIDVM